VAEPLSLRNLWQAFWRDCAKVGLFLTLLAATGYYYITSFFLIDTVLYSYLLLIPILTAVIMMYVVFTTKVRNWLRKVLEEVDREATGVLQWQRFKAEPEMIDLLPWYEYILLVRDYLVKLAKPVFYPSTIFYYILYCGFILSLPYILGIAIEV
jgi:small-conductance mechanosensitive channel